MDLAQWVAAAKRAAGSWPNQAAEYFSRQWGLAAPFAVKLALLYAVLHMAGLNPRITSGFRDPAKQRAMRAAWDRGDRQGLIVRPADPDGSRHCRTALGGSPAATAVDLQCSNNQLAAKIAVALGLRAGEYFSTPDPGHFDGG